MLPKKLTISAFGPYLQPITIDFNDFSNQGLFLITGPTGSGKTMIFDAIMFALFDQASGNERDIEALRNKEATDNQVTSVEFVFILHNQEYRVFRTAKYQKTTNKNPTEASAILSLPDGKEINGRMQVNSKIISLLGVDANHFQQISMLAQGEFTKLIFENSDEREKVLRKLFNTQKYQELVDKLGEKQKYYQDLIGQKQRDIENKINDFSMPDSYNSRQLYLEYLQEIIQSKEKEYHNYQEELNKINIKINQASQDNQNIINLKKEEGKLSKIKENKIHIESIKKDVANLKIINEVNPSYLQFKEYLKNIELEQKELVISKNKQKDINNSFIKATKKYNDIPKLKEEIEIIHTNINMLEQKNIEYIKAVQSKNQYEKQNQTYLDLEGQYNSLKKTYEWKEKQNKIDQSKVDELKLLETKLGGLEKEYQELNQERIKLHRLADKYHDKHKKQDLVGQATEEFQKALQEYEYISNKLKVESQNYLNNQAGILAKSLKDNQPCPVCGSLHHPKKAKLMHEVLSIEKLNDLQVKTDIVYTKQKDKFDNMTLAKNQLLIIENYLEQEAKVYGLEKIDKESITQLLLDKETKLNFIEKENNKLKEEINYLNTLKISLEQSIYNQETLGVQLQQKEANLISLKSQLDQNLGKINWELLEIKQEDLVNELNEKKLSFRLKNDQVTTIQERYNKLKTQNSLVIKEIEDKENRINVFSKNKDKYYQEYLSKLNEYKLDNLYFLKHVDELIKLDEFIEEVSNYEISLNNSSSIIETFKNIVGTKKLVDIQKLEVEKEKLNLINKNLYSELTTLNSKYQNYLRLHQEIIKLEKETEKYAQPYQLYTDLYNVTLGKDGKRISLERYVLAAYFEKILVYANSNLKHLSQGRYQFLRRDESKGNGKKGLDLNVLDLESGTVRDVKTLSGGESFKAALSLALGLSSMIQDYAGGIELNALFIDEGFGSLDSQSLDVAINALLEVQGQGKLIGIISHVRELRERIDKQIILERTDKITKIEIRK